MNKFDCFIQDLGRKKHDLNSDILKIMLTNVPPVKTNNITGNISEISPSASYPVGGLKIENTSFNQKGGVGYLTGFNLTFHGPIGPFRYPVLYNASSGNNNLRPLIGWWDYENEVTLKKGEHFVITFDGSIFEIGEEVEENIQSEDEENSLQVIQN